jgi:hypothetical protein
MAKTILPRLRDVMADLTRAAPPRRIDPGCQDWVPRAVASADLASPYFLAMADLDARWYQNRISPGVWAGLQ